MDGWIDLDRGYEEMQQTNFIFHCSLTVIIVHTESLVMGFKLVSENHKIN